MSNVGDRQTHWQDVYRAKGETDVSWFQQQPAISLEMIKASGCGRYDSIIDIGGGASRLVDALLDAGYAALTVLDLSAEALEIAKARLGARAKQVQWVVADVTNWTPPQQFALWHDRAAFHFLTEPADRAAYVDCLARALRPGGQAIIGTFALDGPAQCSGLPVVRYDAAALSHTLGSAFELLETRADDHRTPWGSTQKFQFSRLRKSR